MGVVERGIGWLSLSWVALSLSSVTCATPTVEPPSPACEAGLSPCDGDCVDVTASDAHCGACGHACHPQQRCEESLCVARCPSGRLFCDDACTDVLIDNAHCGGCGTPCGEGQQCQGGSCRCVAGGTWCDACVDTSTSVAHCGGCDAPCPGDFDVCGGGTCAQDCTAHGRLACDGICRDVDNDDAHCGDCDRVCAAGYACALGDCTCASAPCGLCEAVELAGALPISVDGSTVGVASVVDPACGSPSAGEAIYRFTAPAAATYIFRTLGVTFDPAIYALAEDGCDSLGCYTAIAGDATMAVTLAAAETVLLVVDGAGMGAEGSFALEVAVAPACPDADLGASSPQSSSGTTSGAASLYTGSCFGGGGPERVFGFTARAAGTFTIDTFGSSYDTTLYVRDATCGGAELACNDDTGGLQSSVQVTLAAGQTIRVFVDGAASTDFGAFTLNISGP